MFEMLFTELTRQIRMRSGNGAEWIVTRPNESTSWAYPFTTDASSLTVAYNEQQYGEAECQLVMSVRKLVYAAINSGRPIPTTTVLTIDTDIVLQLAGAYVPLVRAVWAKVWVSDAGVSRTSKKAPANSEPRWEVVHTSSLLEGQTQTSMAWRVFGWLCVGGVDYCDGLGGFGWQAESIMVLLALAPAITVCRAGALSIDIPAIAAALKRTRKTRRRETVERNGGGHALAVELDRIVFCLRYFMWIDSTRPDQGGPVEVAIFPTTGPPDASVTSWLESCADADVVVLGEDHPSRVTLEPPDADGAPSQYLESPI
jgi:hypothetical protein